MARNRAAWEALAEAPAEAPASGDPASPIPSAAAIGDLRVPQLLSTAWNQEQDVFNHSTPNHYPCGCTATSLGQIMYFHRWPDAAHPVQPRETYFYVDGIRTNGVVAGGVYDWDAMPRAAGGASAAQRRAVGDFLRDLGYAFHMQYAESGSGAYLEDAAEAMRGVFRYAQADTAVLPKDPTLTARLRAALERTVLASLDAGAPCGLGVDGIGAHAVVADGYGYDAGVLHVHVNMGWGGSEDYWYAVPDFGSFDTIFQVVSAISPETAWRAVSGRVLDASGAPVAGAAVAVSPADGGASFAATSDERGVWAVRVPVPETSERVGYSASASKGGLASSAREASVARAADGHAWGVSLRLAPAGTAPEAPTDLSATLGTAIGRVVLSWTAGEGWPCELWRAASDSFAGAELVAEGIWDGAFEDTGAPTDADSWYRVRAGAPDGTPGAWSAPARGRAGTAAGAIGVGMDAESLPWTTTTTHWDWNDSIHDDWSYDEDATAANGGAVRDGGSNTTEMFLWTKVRAPCIVRWRWRSQGILSSSAALEFGRGAVAQIGSKPSSGLTALAALRGGGTTDWAEESALVSGSGDVALYWHSTGSFGGNFWLDGFAALSTDEPYFAGSFDGVSRGRPAFSARVLSLGAGATRATVSVQIARDASFGWYDAFELGTASAAGATVAGSVALPDPNATYYARLAFASDAGATLVGDEVWRFCPVDYPNEDAPAFAAVASGVSCRGLRIDLSLSSLGAGGGPVRVVLERATDEDFSDAEPIERSLAATGASHLDIPWHPSSEDGTPNWFRVCAVDAAGNAARAVVLRADGAVAREEAWFEDLAASLGFADLDFYMAPGSSSWHRWAPCLGTYAAFTPSVCTPEWNQSWMSPQSTAAYDADLFTFVSGPATLSFRYQRTDNDGAEIALLVDGAAVAMEGTDAADKSVELPAGEHVVRWRYRNLGEKRSGIQLGAFDLAGPGRPKLADPAVRRTSAAAATATVRLSDVGAAPCTVTLLASADEAFSAPRVLAAFERDAPGAIEVPFAPDGWRAMWVRWTAVSAAGIAARTDAVRVGPALDAAFARAVGAPGRSFWGDTEAGAGPWEPAPGEGPDGGAAVRSGDVPKDSWDLFVSDGIAEFSTWVDAPGTVSFDWRAWYRGDVNGARGVYFYVDGVEVANNYLGKTDYSDRPIPWARYTYELATGGHLLTWRHVPGSADMSPSECRGWVANLTLPGPAPREETLTDVPVPFAWLESRFPGQASSPEDYDALAEADPDGDGFATWKEYLCGTDPDDADDHLRATIRMENGSPVVDWNLVSPLSGARKVVEGVASLPARESDWTSPPLSDARFFRVRVLAPGE